MITILLAKPMTVKGCFFVIAGIIGEEELRVSEEEEADEDEQADKPQ